MNSLFETSFKPHPLDWVVSGLREQLSYLEKPMFGCRACYLHGNLVVVLAAQDEEPWDGVLIATDRGHHQSLMKEIPGLFPHPVLGKWLYIRQRDEEFEKVVEAAVRLILRHDPRIGVPPSKKGGRKRKRGKKRS